VCHSTTWLVWRSSQSPYHVFWYNGHNNALPSHLRIEENRPAKHLMVQVTWMPINDSVAFVGFWSALVYWAILSLYSWHIWSWFLSQLRHRVRIPISWCVVYLYPCVFILIYPWLWVSFFLDSTIYYFSYSGLTPPLYVHLSFPPRVTQEFFPKHLWAAT
jgi:hypothetical protein